MSATAPTPAPAVPAPAPAGERHDVTAVLVTHDGERWLPRVLPALHEQTRPWQRLIVADTGSTDSTPGLLREWVPDTDVLPLPRSTGYGAAVKAALARHAPQNPTALAGPGLHSSRRASDVRSQRVTWRDGDADAPADADAEGPVEWVWLLHDDAEPAPDALEHLLAAVEADPGLGVVGAKIRGWYHRRVLLEVGVTIDAGGRRETSLERGEQDQGQHDHRRETLAVASAGMLIRRDVWEELRGFDPYLPLMRDDVDLCWRAWLAGHKVAVATAAVVYHAEAAAAERRPVHAGSGRVHLLDRAGAMRVLLANLSTAAFLLALPRLALGSALRAIGYLLAKSPGHAADELLAVGSVLVRPRAVLRMRRARRAGHKVAPGSLRRLFPRPGHQLAQARDALTAVAGGGRVERTTIGRHRSAESGPAAEDTENLDVGAGGVLARRLVRSPVALFVVGMVALALLAGRGLFGGGRLIGGALLPVPGGAGSLWSEYGAAFHAEALGSPGAAPPYLAVLALAGTLLFGHADLAVTVLLLGSVPLAGLTAYLAAAPLPTSRALRLWGAGAYALLPVLSGAVAAGRVGTAVAVALLPLLILAGARAVGLPGRDGTVRAAAAAALLLALMTAFVPLAWPLGLAGVAAVLVVRGGRDRALQRRLAGIALAPLPLLLPWSASLFAHPSRLLGEPGLPIPADRPGWTLVLLDPGGAGPGPGWVGLGVVAAGLAGLGMAGRRTVPLLAWAVAGAALAVALVQSRLDVTAPAGGPSGPSWPGLTLALAGGAMLAAAVVGTHGAAERLTVRDFGPAQVAVALVVALAIGAPLVGAASWLVRGADDPLARGGQVLLPAHVAAEADTSDRPRTLVLRSGSTADRQGEEGLPTLSYALVRSGGPQLGAVDVTRPGTAAAALEGLVGDLVSGRDAVAAAEPAARLADFAVRYVLVQEPVDDGIRRALDAVPGLERVSSPSGAGLWRLAGESARLRVLGPDEPAPVESGRVEARTTLAAAAEGAVLALAEPADDRWRAELGGRELRSTVHAGWAQAWELPAGAGGGLTVRWSQPTRGLWLLVQGVALGMAVVLALPGGTRRLADEDDVTVPAPSGRHAHGPEDDTAAPDAVGDTPDADQLAGSRS